MLDVTSVPLADAEWSRRVAELHREFPGWRLRIFRTVHAICPHCGQTLRYLEREDRLVEDPGLDVPQTEAHTLNSSEWT
jgi:hypothetical protein